jgi:hypothetical protein
MYVFLCRCCDLIHRFYIEQGVCVMITQVLLLHISYSIETVLFALFPCYDNIGYQVYIVQVINFLQ